MNLACNRCHTDWPRDRMFAQGGEKFCGLCWRVMIYPQKVGEVIEVLDKPESLVAQALREDPAPHPFRYQKS